MRIPPNNIDMEAEREILERQLPPGFQVNPTYSYDFLLALEVLRGMTLRNQIRFMDLVGGSLVHLANALDSEAYMLITPTTPKFLAKFVGADAPRKIQAIKFIREVTGWGLKESKDFADSLEHNGVRSITYDDVQQYYFSEDSWKRAVERFRDTLKVEGSPAGYVFEFV